VSDRKVSQGDCIQEMKEMEESSVDAVVTDPPYGLAFMGKDWDDFEPKEFQEFCHEWGEQALRVLKPGGHLLAFCGTRTYHRMVVGLEDAGFEIRDQIAWMYGSGFPKGQDISKAIDKHKDEYDNRKELGENPNSREKLKEGYKHGNGDTFKADYDPITAPDSDEAGRWSGWNTSLKPGHEPVVVAQKPKQGTYAENVLEHGVGGLNIDACRISTDSDLKRPARKGKGTVGNFSDYVQDDGLYGSDGGRWPANVVLDEGAAQLLDQQSGDVGGRWGKSSDTDTSKNSMFNAGQKGNVEDFIGDSGGASRFFYSAKARKTERNAGLNGTDNDIATLKPINLMRWLTRLVTLEDGTVLDPFAGSGTTGCAAEVEGFNYTLIEKRERFAEKIIPLRCDYWSQPENWDELKDHEEIPSTKQKRNGSLNDFAETCS